MSLPASTGWQALLRQAGGRGRLRHFLAAWNHVTALLPSALECIDSSSFAALSALLCWLACVLCCAHMPWLHLPELT